MFYLDKKSKKVTSNCASSIFVMQCLENFELAKKCVCVLVIVKIIHLKASVNGYIYIYLILICYIDW
jgi:hypothetical protein